MRKIILIATIFLTLSHTVYAEDKTCEKAMTQDEMNKCFSKSSQTFQEKEATVLALVTKRLRERGDKIRLQRFQQLQEQWKSYVAAECEYEADAYKGGTMMPMVYSGCLSTFSNFNFNHLTFMWEDLNL